MYSFHARNHTPIRSSWLKLSPCALLPPGKPGLLWEVPSHRRAAISLMNFRHSRVVWRDPVGQRPIPGSSITRPTD